TMGEGVASIGGAPRLRPWGGRLNCECASQKLVNNYGNPATETLGAPLLQTPQALREFALGLGVIDVPDTRQNLLPELACATGSDLDHRVQVAQDQCDLREEQAPSFPGRRPTIGTDRVWAVGGEDRFGLLTELAISGLQAF